MSPIDAIFTIEDNRNASQEDIVQAFQVLIDSGIVWSLQGSYGRTAQVLIEEGYCHA